MICNSSEDLQALYEETELIFYCEKDDPILHRKIYDTGLKMKISAIHLFFTTRMILEFGMGGQGYFLVN